MARPLNALALAGLALLGGSAQGSKLDSSGAFYYPDFAGSPETVLAETSVGAVESGSYLRYLATKFGTRYVDDLAFEMLLAAECKARGLANSAPSLARTIATQRLHDSGRTIDEELRRKYLSEALRDQRVEAIVRADRTVLESEVRALFERRYGPGGVRFRVRHLLVSLAATRLRLANEGVAIDENTVIAAARRRVERLHAKVLAGTSLADLLDQTDERRSQALLADPATADRAGFVDPRNLRRYGRAYNQALRGLEVGDVSGPVRSRLGFHLIEVVERTVTKYETVEAALRRDLMAGAPSPQEVDALRRALFEKYRFRSKR